MILKLKNIKKEYKISKKYNEVIFNNLNLSFKSGEFVCILGESGAGKSTLMNIIGGLDSSYEGNIYVDNVNLKSINLDNYRRENIGFIFQNFNLISNLTVLENVMIKLDMSKISIKDKISKSKQILKELGLEKEIHKRPNELSGGQRQRVAIARTLVTDPDIILADEPTGALDSENSIKVLEILKGISEKGKLVIVVTHSQKVLDYSSRLITIDDGQVMTDEVISEVDIENEHTSSKQKNISFLTSLKFGIRNIINNLKRNILISLASSIGIVGIIISLYIGDGVKDYIDNEINNKANPKILDIKKKGTNELYEVDYFNSEDINNILSVKNIKKIYKQSIYTNSASISFNNQKYDLVTFSSYNNIDEDELEEGKLPKDNEIVISKYLADKIVSNENYSSILGKEIDLYILDNSSTEPFIINEKVKISGIYKRDKLSIIADSMYGYISYSNLNTIYNKNSKKLLPTNLSVEVDDEDNIDMVKKNVDSLGFECTSSSSLLEDIYSYLDIATFILSSFSILSLIVSSIMIMIIMHINVVERTKEIGILRSLGARKKDIKRIFKSEALILGLVVGSISIIISNLISFLIKDIIYNNFEINFTSIKGEFMLMGILLSTIICIISSLIPASKASKVDPVDALRYE